MTVMSTNADERNLAPASQEASLERAEVDVSVMEYLLSLSAAQRAEKHYHARLFAARMRQIARKRYGPALDAAEASD